MGKRANGDPDGRKVIVKWLRDGLKLRGKTPNDAAEVIGMLRAHGPKLITGQRRITADEMFALSRFLQIPVPRLGAPDGDGTADKNSAPVVCRVNGAIWTSHPLFSNGTSNLLPHEQFDGVPIIPRPDLQGIHQSAVVVTGDLVAHAIRNGEFAIWVPYHQARKEYTPGDYVLVEIERAGLYNAFVLRLEKPDGHWLLQTVRADGTSEPLLTLNADCTAVVKPRIDEKVSFIGLVISRYAPLSS